MVIERLLGAGFGLLKAGIAVALPVIAMQGPNNVPEPPVNTSGLINPIESGTNASTLVPALQAFANNLSPALKALIVSDSQPSFKPDFSGKTILDNQSPDSQPAAQPTPPPKHKSKGKHRD